MRLRRYLPADACSSGEAAILFVHGGGCVLGDVEISTTYCAAPCATTRERPCCRSTIGSRLSIPSPPRWEDTVAALAWLSHEAGALGLDAKRIAIAGDSAGGGLAAVALHETKGRCWRRRCAHRP